MEQQTTETLRMILLDPLTAFGHKIASVMPNIIGAIAIIIAGYFVSKFLAFFIKKFCEKVSLNSFSQKAGIDTLFEKIEVKMSLSELVSKIVFYIIFISFIMSAAETLGMDVMADALKSILFYLPNVIAAVFILAFGLFVAKKASLIVSKSAHGMNLDFAEYLGKVVYGVILIISISLAIGQLEIETTLLNQAASIILIAIGVALALSLGLGTKELSSLIIAGNYIKDIYKIGDTIQIDDTKGEIIEIGTTKVVIKTQENKEISICNEKLLKQTVIKG